MLIISMTRATGPFKVKQRSLKLVREILGVRFLNFFNIYVYRKYLKWLLDLHSVKCELSVTGIPVWWGVLGHRFTQSAFR